MKDTSSLGVDFLICGMEGKTNPLGSPSGAPERGGKLSVNTDLLLLLHTSYSPPPQIRTRIDIKKNNSINYICLLYQVPTYDLVCRKE